MFVLARSIKISEYSENIYRIISHTLPVVQKCFVKMLFNRKTSAAESYYSKESYYSRTPALVFSCKFIPENSRTAVSELSSV